MNIVIVLLIILGSVILHELSHGLVAYWLGDDTAKVAGRLTFNPIKHIDPFMSILVPVVLYLMHAPVFGGAKPVPINTRNLKWREWGMALVAVAGPFTNFLLALISFLIGHFTGWLYGAGGETMGFIFTELILINLGFMIFNLIPIPPLDGSRVLYAIAPDGFRDILASVEQYGFIIVYMLIFLFGDVFSGIMSGSVDGILNFFYWIVGVK
ncbi:MAG: site-2 protease family protein [Candidatus Saccharibacteria bacterium]|nr:site-2 protease family protein [Candidatus Saccharibacteria bacterium]